MPSSLTRRRFLQFATVGIASATGGLTVSPLGSSAATSKGNPVKVIDTHVHFYDPTRAQGVPWPPKDDKLLYRTVLPKDYKALPQQMSVAGVVVVEASVWVEDNQWILDLAAKDKLITGFVGNLPVGTSEFRTHLKRFTANKLYRGLRIKAATIAEGLTQSQFISDMKLLGEQDIAVDLLGPPAMLADASKLAAQVPGTRLLIDHVANVKIDGKAPPDDWLSGMRAVARNKNVFCKVSGLVEGSGRRDGTAPRDVEFYKPVLDAIWEAFGEDRLVYGSNWPVSERFASCAVVQQIARDYFSTKGSGVTDKIFWKNAQAFYKWVER